MHHNHAAEAHRVGVLQRRSPMGSPAGMCNACMAIWLYRINCAAKAGYIAFHLDAFDVTSVEGRDAR